MGRGRALSWLCWLLLLPTPALALPQTYSFVSGTARVTAQVIGQPDFLVDTLVALDGTFIDFDEALVSVTDFEISIAPTAPIAMSGSYGGFDTFSIDAATLSPGTGYSSSGVSVGGSQYSVAMGPLDVNAIYSASDSTLTNPPVSGVPITFTNPSLTATVDTDLIVFELVGVTLGVLPGYLVGEASDLIVKGDIVFIGAVPEPTTGALLGLGLLGLAAPRFRSARASAPRR